MWYPGKNWHCSRKWSAGALWRKMLTNWYIPLYNTICHSYFYFCRHTTCSVVSQLLLPCTHHSMAQHSLWDTSTLAVKWLSLHDRIPWRNLLPKMAHHLYWTWGDSTLKFSSLPVRLVWYFDFEFVEIWNILHNEGILSNKWICANKTLSQMACRFITGISMKSYKN